MGRVNNNTIDKFGRQRINQQHAQVVVRALPGIGFKLTSDGQYDIEGKSLTNVGNPKGTNDAATKEYVINELRELRQNIFSAVNKDMVKCLNDRLHHIEGPGKKFDDVTIKDYINRELLELRQEILSIINKEIIDELKEKIEYNKGMTHSIWVEQQTRLDKMDRQIKTQLYY